MLNTLPININKSKSLQKADSTYFESRKFGSMQMLYFPEKTKRTRLVVKKGIENISMRLEEIAFFFTENKIVYVIDHSGRKYIAERSLIELEKELDNSVFFRANRQYIINIDHIKSFKAYEKVKLKIDMRPEELNDQYYIIVSQETAPAFRKWINAV